MTTTTISTNDLVGKLDENLNWVNENKMTLTIKSNDTFTLIPATTNTALINLTQQSQLLNETDNK
jgi:hypothetical protein